MSFRVSNYRSFGSSQWYGWSSVLARWCENLEMDKYFGIYHLSRLVLRIHEHTCGNPPSYIFDCCNRLKLSWQDLFVIFTKYSSARSFNSPVEWQIVLTRLNTSLHYDAGRAKGENVGLFKKLFDFFLSLYFRILLITAITHDRRTEWNYYFKYPLIVTAGESSLDKCRWVNIVICWVN